MADPVIRTTADTTRSPSHLASPPVTICFVLKSLVSRIVLSNLAYIKHLPQLCTLLAPPVALSKYTCPNHTSTSLTLRYRQILRVMLPDQRHRLRNRLARHCELPGSLWRQRSRYLDQHLPAAQLLYQCVLITVFVLVLADILFEQFLDLPPTHSPPPPSHPLLGRRLRPGTLLCSLPPSLLSSPPKFLAV